MLAGHTDRLARVAWHPGGRLLATASFDATWRLWDAATSACLLEQEGHSRSVYAVAFHQDGALVASAGLDALGAPGTPPPGPHGAAHAPPAGHGAPWLGLQPRLHAACLLLQADELAKDQQVSSPHVRRLQHGAVCSSSPVGVCRLGCGIATAGPSTQRHLHMFKQNVAALLSGGRAIGPMHTMLHC